MPDATQFTDIVVYGPTSTADLLAATVAAKYDVTAVSAAGRTAIYAPNDRAVEILAGVHRMLNVTPSTTVAPPALKAPPKTLRESRESSYHVSNGALYQGTRKIAGSFPSCARPGAHMVSCAPSSQITPAPPNFRASDAAEASKALYWIAAVLNAEVTR